MTALSARLSRRRWPRECDCPRPGWCGCSRRSGAQARPARRAAARQRARPGPAGLGPTISARPFHPPARRTCTAGWPSNWKPCGTRRGIEAQRARAARRGQIDHRHAGLPLCAAAGRLGAVHLDRLRHAAPGLRPPGEHQGRVARQPAAGRGLSAGGRPRAGLAPGSIVLRNGVAIEAFGTGQRIRGRRRRRPSAHADPLRRPAERRPHPVGRAARSLAELVPRHADEGRHAPDQRGQPGHRPAPRGPGHGAAPPARAGSRGSSRPSSAGRRTCRSGSSGKPCTPTWRTPATAARPGPSTSSTAGRWTPAPWCSGRRRKTCTR